MLTAIETTYHGFKFRSRIEARWATFLDNLEIPYSYETEGYDLDGTWYLPDFWLPQQECFIEIKGQEPTPEEIKKAKLLSLKSSKRVFIAQGAPWFDTRISAYSHGIRQDIVHASRWVWFICPTCGAPGLMDLAYIVAGAGIQAGYHNPGCRCSPARIDHKNSLISDAYLAARQARFEQ